MQFIKEFFNKLYSIFLFIKNLPIGERAIERELKARLTQIIINSSNSEELKNKVVREIADSLNASRCFFIELNESTNQFYKVTNSFNTKREYTSILGYNIENNLPEFAAKLKYVNTLLIEDTSKYLKENSKIEEFFIKYDIKSYIAVKLEFGETFLGILNVQYNYKKSFIKNTDLKFLKSVSGLISIALHLSKLHTEEKIEKEKESLLRKIFETMRKSLDSSEMKKIIINEVGKALNVDRLFIAEYDKKNEKFKIIEHEYISSEKVITYKGKDANIDAPDIIESIKNGQTIIFNNEKLSTESEMSFEIEKQVLEEYQVKSLCVVPLQFKNEFLGGLVVGYSHEHYIDNNEKELQETIANQISIALYQAKIYSKIKKNIANQNAILNNLPFMAWLKDKKSKLLAANKAFADNCNTTIEDLIGKTDYDFFDEELAESYIKEDKIVMDTGKTLYSNDLINGPKGQRWHETFKSPVIGENNEIIGTAGFSRDITETINNEKNLLKTQKEITEKRATENLVRKIVDTIRSTLELEKMKKQIVTEIGKAFNVERCIIHQMNTETGKFYIIDENSEYMSLDDIPSYAGIDIENEDLKFFKGLFSSGKEMIAPNWPEYLNKLENIDEKTKEWINTLQIKSDYVFPIIFNKKLLATLYLTYTKNYKELSDDELNALRILSNQIAIALHQAELYKNTKQLADREQLVRNIIEEIRSSLSLDDTLTFICKETVKLFNATRASIVRYPDNKTKKMALKKEYKVSEEIKGLNVLGDITTLRPYWDELLDNSDNIAIINNINDQSIPLAFREIYERINAKSLIAVALRNENKTWGSLVISDQEKYRNWTQEEVDLLKSITSQIYIAITQAEYYESQKQAKERESLLRSITERIRSTLDLEETLSYICEETAKIFNVQRTAITMFPNLENYEEFELRKEYKTSKDIKGVKEIQEYSKIAATWGKTLMESKAVFSIDSIINSDILDSFKDFYISIGIKAIIGTAIRKGDKAWGTLVLSEYYNERIWTEEEKDLLNTIADQVYIAINQAEMYEAQKKAAEREKISRNIIEILRSSIDKTIIKKLFVKNIGKFFNADRVMYSEYDNNEKKYLPADENSEYLSDTNEKSLIGYDWSKEEIRELIEPLLEKREVNIFDWDEYIKMNIKSENFINFFESYKIKSSYNFPVLYQQKMMGFFCIDFMNTPRKLADEDINRIRSICTQAGIALYHAELYSEAQECLRGKSIDSFKLLQKIKEPTNNILETSTMLYENEYPRNIELEYLKSIIESCNNLLNLTDNI